MVLKRTTTVWYLYLLRAWEVPWHGYKYRIIMKYSYSSRNRLLDTLGLGTYGEYLRGDLWKSIRSRVVKKAKWKCSLCAARATEVHHVAYTKAALLGTSLRSLVALCEGHHLAVEFDAAGRKRTLESARSEYKRLKPKKL